MKIVIEQPRSEDDHLWDHTGQCSPASVTVDLDDGTRIEFQAQVVSVLDLNPAGLCAYPEESFSQSALARAIREPGHFTVTVEGVQGVEMSHPVPQEDLSDRPHP